MKARSVTLPAAQRAALEECSSFQMVSVSTCGARVRARIIQGFPQESGPSGAVPTPRPGPQGQGAGQTVLPPQCPTAQRQGLLCLPIPAGLLLPSVSPSTSPFMASTLLAASRLPPRSGEGAWRYLGGIGVWAGRGFKPQLTLLRPCGTVGAGGAVCTTVFHSGPLAQAGRPPKPSPWASRLGRGRGA